MRIIGDIHGKLNGYRKLCEGHETIQVGDFGMGHLDPDEYEMLHTFFANGNHRFIRGNHDNPDVCRDFSGYIHDGTIVGDYMFVGGAESLHNSRDAWWEKEQLTYGEFLKVYDDYVTHKPKVMITHDAPSEILHQMFQHLTHGIRSFTNNAFAHMWESHKPDIWVFGHHHQTKRFSCMGTEFICLGELDFIDIGDEYEI